MLLLLSILYFFLPFIARRQQSMRRQKTPCCFEINVYMPALNAGRLYVDALQQTSGLEV
jgi:hypothetical protein